LEKIDELNKSKDVDGFIVQLPLPKQIDQEKSLWQLTREKMWMVFIRKILEKWPGNGYFFAGNAIWNINIIGKI
jgi:hypothetical protein